MMAENAEGKQWAELTAEQFLQGYAEPDAIYDDVSIE